MRFDGRVVLITGGGKGQGREHARTFAAEGADVVVCDVCAQLPTAERMSEPADLDETVRQVEAIGARCLGLVADVRSWADMTAVVDKALSTFGKVDVLVANAGIVSYGQAADLPWEAWRDMVDINLGGVVRAARAVLPHMYERGRGRIVATSSAAGREGVPGCAHYAAAKWGVIGFVKSLAIEAGPHGVTANAVVPMSVDTEMCHNAATYGLFRPDLANPTADDVRETFAAMNPLGVPWLDPSDVSRAVAFLASDDARYITGAALDVAGGWNAHHVA